MTETFYAHTKDGEPPDHWQPLEDHLRRVDELARFFTCEYWAGEYLTSLEVRDKQMKD